MEVAIESLPSKHGRQGLEQNVEAPRSTSYECKIDLGLSERPDPHSDICQRPVLPGGTLVKYKKAPWAMKARVEIWTAALNSP